MHHDNVQLPECLDFIRAELPVPQLVGGQQVFWCEVTWSPAGAGPHAVQALEDLPEVIQRLREQWTLQLLLSVLAALSRSELQVRFDAGTVG